MLVQHPGLPFFAIAGDFYASSSTPSTLTHPQPPPPPPNPPPATTSVSPSPGVLLGLPLITTAVTTTAATTAAVLNQTVALKSLATPDRLCRLYTLNQSSPQSAQQQPAHQHSLVVVCTTQPVPNSQTMPRQSQPKLNAEVDNNAVRSAHPPSVAIVAGVKRNASALSATVPVAPDLPSNPDNPPESGDQAPPRLPPKLKESERMMHVQRWVNHLPWNGNDGQSGQQTQWHYWYRHIDEDRELTPPPSRTYLSRLPFTPEEQQTMLRFFSPNSDYRHPQAGAAPNTYPANAHQLSYHNQRTNALHQAAAAANATATNSHLQQQQCQATPGNANAASGANLDLDRCAKPAVPRRVDAEPAGGSRFFAEWETRLISHLFQDYFPGRPEPMGNAAVALPSLNEVRARIASSRLKETRTAMAVRAKIKRMQSSGTWIEYP